jgi:phosphoribosylanthranilate isomerase
MTRVNRTRIKICGICRAEDAHAACDAGADAIGLVFHPAAGRYVTPDQAMEILRRLPAMVWTVGLFVDAPVDSIRAIVSQTHLSAVQLHGHESPELVAALKPVPVIKALRLDANLGNTLREWEVAIPKLDLTNLAGLIMETPSTGAPGGTGIANDWPALANHVRAGDFQKLPPLIAAGGLTPESVGGVVRTIRPYAVDVSSGVESVRRQKSPDKIRAFVRAVRDADATAS